MLNKKYILLIIVMVLVSFNVFATNNNLTNQLKAYYSFDNNTNDLVGTYNFTNTGSSYTTGKINAGLLSGTGESNTGINFVNFDAVTINFWSKGLDGHYTFGTNNGGAPAMGTYSISTDGNINFKVYASVDTTITCPFDNNVYTQYTYLINKTFMAIYKNGTMCSNSSISFSTYQNLNMAMFNYKTGIGSDANTYMDEVSVWNRTLNQSEITELYNSGSGLSYADITYVYVTPTPLNFTYTKTCFFNGTGLSLNLMSGCY